LEGVSIFIDELFLGGELFLHNSWVGVNSIALVASLLLSLGLIGLYAKLHARGGILGPIGFILAFFGSVLYVCLQFDETFTWPIIGAHAVILRVASVMR